MTCYAKLILSQDGYNIEPMWLLKGNMTKKMIKVLMLSLKFRNNLKARLYENVITKN